MLEASGGYARGARVGQGYKKAQVRGGGQSASICQAIRVCGYPVDAYTFGPTVRTSSTIASRYLVILGARVYSCRLEDDAAGWCNEYRCVIPHVIPHAISRVRSANGRGDQGKRSRRTSSLHGDARRKAGIIPCASTRRSSRAFTPRCYLDGPSAIDRHTRDEKVCCMCVCGGALSSKRSPSGSVRRALANEKRRERRERVLTPVLDRSVLRSSEF